MPGTGVLQASGTSNGKPPKDTYPEVNRHVVERDSDSCESTSPSCCGTDSTSATSSSSSSTLVEVESPRLQTDDSQHSVEERIKVVEAILKKVEGKSPKELRDSLRKRGRPYRKPGPRVLYDDSYDIYIEEGLEELPEIIVEPPDWDYCDEE